MSNTTYAHPLAGIESKDNLAEAFRETFDLAAQNHGDTVTVPLEDNWDADAVLELLEATPFTALGFDTDEVTVVLESELTDK